MRPFFKSYPSNQHGHDFVVGDLHGHGQMLLHELARMGFDKSRDRVFCTGDLIDRGPLSFETLMLAHEPWFHFVKGNHEDDLPLFIQHEYPQAEPGVEWEPDQAWVYRLSPKRLEYLKTVMLPLLADAPVVLKVEGEHGFWMVHADRSEWGGYGKPTPLLDDFALPFARGDNQLEVLLWSRRLHRQIPHADLVDRGLFLAAPGQELTAGVGLTFTGHNAVEKQILYRSHLMIDTGAGTFPDGKLTVMRVVDVLESKPFNPNAQEAWPV